MKLTQKKLNEMLKKACEHGACNGEIELIKSLTISEILEHEKLSFWCYWYVYYIIKNRWPEAEEYIKRDHWYACRYAKYILKSRWPEAEECIEKDPCYAYLYAKYILKSRWPEAEECIKRDLEYACRYACDVIKSRWPEAEEYIEQDEFWWNFYQKKFGIKQ